MPETKRSYEGGQRAGSIERVLDATDAMLRHVSDSHTSEFLEIGVTMPQAKTLHLVAAEGRIRMSVLATRLGVTLSTVSGLVERLVEAGCVARHDDPTDRRQVVVTLTPTGDALIERFRDLNRSQMRSLLVLLSDADLVTVERAVTALTRAAEQRDADRGGAPATDPTLAPPSGRLAGTSERDPS